MKIYRTSYYKKRSGHLRTFIWLGVGIFLFLCVFFPMRCWWFAMFCAFSPMIFLAGPYLAAHFYVALDDSFLYVRNPAFLFLGKQYRLSEIKKVYIGFVGGRSYAIFLRVDTKQKRGWRRNINLVNDDDLFALIGELQQRGIAVDTEELQIYIEYLERQKREKAQGEVLRHKAREYEELMRRERERMKQ